MKKAFCISLIFIILFSGFGITYLWLSSDLRSQYLIDRVKKEKGFKADFFFSSFNNIDIGNTDFSDCEGLSWDKISRAKNFDNIKLPPLDLTGVLPDKLNGVDFSLCTNLDVMRMLAHRAERRKVKIPPTNFIGKSLKDFNIDGIDFSNCTGLTLNQILQAKSHRFIVLPPLDLSESDFQDKDISFIDFSNCTGITWGKVISAKEYCGIKLPSLDFTNIDFSNAYIDGIDFSKCTGLMAEKLIRAKSITFILIPPMDFSGADFSGVDIDGIDFSKCTGLTAKQIMNAKSWNPKSELASYWKKPAILPALNFAGVSFKGKDIRNLDLSKAYNLTWEQITEASDFSGVKLPENLTEKKALSDLDNTTSSDDNADKIFKSASELFKTDKMGAVKLFLKASQLGNIKANTMLGDCYLHGLGVEKSEKLAVSYFTKAAEKNDPQAQFSLGMCYAFGDGVPQDKNVAEDWMIKAAKQGNKTYQYLLAMLYLTGKEIRKDEAMTIFWLEKAAEQDEENAQFYLASAYRNASGGLIEDPKKAFYWYEKSANNGHPESMAYLFMCYNKGYGCEKNPNLAMEWLRKSAKAGNAESINALEKIDKKENFDRVKILSALTSKASIDLDAELGSKLDKINDYLKQNPISHEAYLNRLNLNIKIGDKRKILGDLYILQSLSYKVDLIDEIINESGILVELETPELLKINSEKAYKYLDKIKEKENHNAKIFLVNEAISLRRDIPAFYMYRGLIRQNSGDIDGSNSDKNLLKTCLKWRK